MPLFNMTVVRADGSKDVVVAGPKQQIAFEKARKKGLGSAFNGSNLYIEDVYWLAWKADSDATIAGGGTATTFDVWLDEITDVELSGSTDPT